MKNLRIIAAVVASLSLSGCLEAAQNSDAIQSKAQETLLKEGTAQTGMPAIKNFRERRLLKMIYELRDQEGLSTYSYTVSAQTGQLNFLCASVGYAINDATGYTNPNRVVRDNSQVFGTMTQAEPNGLYTPDSSEAYWVMCLDAKTGKPSPVFVATPVVVSPIKF